MSRITSNFSRAAVLGTLALACCFILPAAPQATIDAPGVTVDTGGAVLHRATVVYPDAARKARVQGVVTVEATVDNTGNVVETRVLSGPTELRRAAQQSVLSWHFATDTSANTRQVKVTFELPAESASGSTTGVLGGIIGSTPSSMDAASRAVFEERMKTLQTQIGSMPTIRVPASLDGKRVTRIYVGGLTEQGRKDLLSRLPVHEGDTLTVDSVERLSAAVKAFDEHLNIGTAANQNNEVSFTIQTLGNTLSVEPGFPNTVSPMAVPPAADGTKRITVGGNVQQAKLVSQPRPVYPPLAKQARISGVVHLQALIGKDGNIVNLAVISGHPLLVPAALDAVRQWVYQKTLLNGDPVEVMTQIDVNFTLSDAPPVQQ